MLAEKQKLKIRTIIEILGKPEEHVIKTIKLIVAKLKGEPGIKVLKEDISKTSKHDNLFSIFTELELELESIDHLTFFVFQYMPSVIEIMEPEEVKLTARDMTAFMGDIQSRLHSIDAKLKTAIQERKNFSTSLVIMAKNNLINVIRLGANKGLSKDVISKYTGISLNDLDQFLKILLDEGKIVFENDLYKINLNFSEKKPEVKVEDKS